MTRPNIALSTRVEGTRTPQVALLERDGALFEKVEADQPSSGKKLDAFGASPRRAVLVDNRPSCHSTQPNNGILVEDYWASARELHLSGGARAIGGVFDVRASASGVLPRRASRGDPCCGTQP